MFIRYPIYSVKYMYIAERFDKLIVFVRAKVCNSELCLYTRFLGDYNFRNIGASLLDASVWKGSVNQGSSDNSNYTLIRVKSNKIDIREITQYAVSNGQNNFLYLKIQNCSILVSYIHILKILIY